MGDRSREQPREADPRRAGGPIDRELIRLLPSLRTTVAASVVLGLVATASLVVQAVFLADLLAGVMPGARPGDRALDLCVVGFAFAVRAAAAFAAEVVSARGAQRAKAELRRRLVGAALRLGSTNDLDGPGGVATVAGRGLDALDVYFGRCLPDFVLAALAPLALAAAIGVLDWLSLVVVLVAMALFPVFGALVGRSSTELAAARWREVEALGRRVVDIFEGLPILRAFARSAEQRQRIEETGRALTAASLSTLRVAFLSGLVLDTLGSVSVALLAVPLGLRLLDGSVHLAPALAVLVIAPEVFLPLRRASAEFHESTEGLAAARQAMTLVGTDTRAPHGQGSGRAPDPCRVPLHLHSVRVELPGRRAPVLDGASLTIEPGETVALVGSNGIGKSTVVATVLGFVTPTAGAVTIGGEDLRAIDLGTWHRHVSYVPEHPTLLPATLADNLRVANPDASDAELEAALCAADAAELLALPGGGLRARVGDGGIPLSAGERQRVAIARALCRPASFYVFDEPTVHLDDATESQVVEALRATLSKKSALVISHRDAPLSLADRIVTIESGRILPADAGASPASALTTSTR